MSWKFNPFTKKLDVAGMSAVDKANYLKLDQTTPQSVINDAPHFDGGIILKAGQKLIFDGA